MTLRLNLHFDRQKPQACFKKCSSENIAPINGHDDDGPFSPNVRDISVTVWAERGCKHFKSIIAFYVSAPATAMLANPVADDVMF